MEPEEHELDWNGEIIHVDVDERIPTGVCNICLEDFPKPKVE